MLQKTAIRLVFNVAYLEHTNPLFFIFRSLKLIDIYNYNLGILVFQNKVLNVFHRNHNYSTRNRDSLTTEFQRLSITQHSVSFSAAGFWNKIPIGIRESNNLSNFKSALKLYLLENYAVQ